MQHPRYHNQAPDHLETALEASCGVLMALESIRSRAGDSATDDSSVQAHVQQAIESLREAITELRLARSETVSAIALGFIAESPIDGRQRKGQPRPRRTA